MYGVRVSLCCVNEKISRAGTAVQRLDEYAFARSLQAASMGHSSDKYRAESDEAVAHIGSEALERSGLFHRRVGIALGLGAGDEAFFGIRLNQTGSVGRVKNVRK